MVMADEEEVGGGGSSGACDDGDGEEEGQSKPWARPHRCLLSLLHLWRGGMRDE